jgi:hypothetical protein
MQLLQRYPTGVRTAQREQMGLPQRLQRKEVGTLGWLMQKD